MHFYVVSTNSRTIFKDGVLRVFKVNAQIQYTNGVTNTVLLAV